MTKPLIKIHNVETNEVIEREMTDEEFAQFELDEANAASRAEAKAEAKAAKEALLEKLGITEDEAKLLLA
jgi:ParB-like chromosome segregation protein Spo0J